ncbi:glutathione synthetase [Leptinotarsa decemlineata]|uniref:glutathione synthetase n=1 Tax=Leptinotarsa decemlineata TaxID=7539 RepID=UPI003D3097EB
MSKPVPKLPNQFLPITKDVLKETVLKAKDWAILHGCSMRSKNNYSEDSVQISPFNLLPSSFPRREFNKVVELQTVFNELMHRVAHDREFVEACFKDTIQVDEFTGNLFKIYETVQQEGVSQEITVGLFRSDYLLHSTSNNNLKQVELNTIASSFSGIGTYMTQYHRYILQELGHFDKIKNLPDNDALTGSSQGLLDAWKLYGNPDSIIVFLTEEVTYNICDQRLHEFEISKLNPEVKVLRRSLTDIHDRGSINSKGELIIDNDIVGLVYLRVGYEPDNYPSKKEWDARLLIERSKAIKCPNIQYHLVGQKKVQQALAKSGVLERFLTDPKKIEALREVFVGLYGLEFDEFGDQAVQMALDDPERYVLKPQREGGGNNLYGKDVRDFMLKVKDTKERTSWILMERILPPSETGYMIVPGGPNPPPLSETVSELGIFGVLIGDPQKIIVNKQVGHMLRTKAADSDEGGVIAGFGALDSPYLID